MRADLSRITFDAGKRYAGVVVQQGRVLLDADLNEQADLARHRAASTATDVIGRVGVPSSGGGFAVATTPGGKDLLVTPGRLYVDGVAVEHEPEEVDATAESANVLKLAATDLDDAAIGKGDWLEVLASTPVVLQVVADPVGSSITLSGPHTVTAPVRVRRATTVGERTVDGSTLTDGRYVVVLHAVLRDVSALDDPDLVEPALGGPDTSIRLRTCWEVLLAPVGATGTCDQWVPPARAGTLEPVVSAPTVVSGDCALPGDAGLTGLENRLYRVEVNGVDASGAVTSLLWDRDNAAVASLVENVGVRLTLHDFGPDDARGFGSGQTVTLADAPAERRGAGAPVFTTANPDQGARTLDVSPAPTGFENARRPRIRRWSGHVTNPPVGTPILLEEGLSVRLMGTFRTGEHWLIPARTALGGPGGLAWPRTGGTTGPYRPLPPTGPEEHWAPLALVDHKAGAFTVVDDCRTVFPTLVEVQKALAGRTGGESCTVVVAPGPNWDAPLRALAPGTDARICFLPGVFATERRVVLSGLGHLVLHGAGPGTELRASVDEAALVLDGCDSVTVRDMAFAATGTVEGNDLVGALTVTGCRRVRLEALTASCASATAKRATCVTVTGPPRGGREGTRAVVRDCELWPGEYQVGLLVRDFGRVDVTGVVVEAPWLGFPKLGKMSPALHARLRRMLVGHLAVRGRGGTIGNVDIDPVRFRTLGPLVQPWREVLAALPPPPGGTDRAIRAHVYGIADRVLRRAAHPELQPLRSALTVLFFGRKPVAAQGIVVAGPGLGAARVEGNTVRNAIQGIHVAIGRGRQADRVVIRDNVVDVRVPFESAGSWHGIFVGGSRSVTVADNEVTLTNDAPSYPYAGEGIRIWGALGRNLLLRDNYISGPSWVGVRVMVAPGSFSGNTVRWGVRGTYAANAGFVVVRNDDRIEVPIDNRP